MLLLSKQRASNICYSGYHYNQYICLVCLIWTLLCPQSRSVDCIHAGSMAGRSTESQRVIGEVGWGQWGAGQQCTWCGRRKANSKVPRIWNMDNEANPSNGYQACMAATDIDNMGVTNYIWSDMVYKLECSYIDMCETMCEHANYRKSKLYHREHKIRKSPMKIHDMIRKKIIYIYIYIGSPGSDIRVGWIWTNHPTQLQYQQQRNVENATYHSSKPESGHPKKPNGPPQEVRHSNTPRHRCQQHINREYCSMLPPPGHLASIVSPMQVQSSSLRQQIETEMRRCSRGTKLTVASSTVSHVENHHRQKVQWTSTFGRTI